MTGAAARKWDKRVDQAQLMASTPGFLQLRDRIVELAAPRASDRVVDLGAGTGLLSMAFAKRAALVWAIDSSPAMVGHLKTRSLAEGITNIECVLASVVRLPLGDATADLVVSNYCLHEVRGPDKRRALAEARRV